MSRSLPESRRAYVVLQPFAPLNSFTATIGRTTSSPAAIALVTAVAASHNAGVSVCVGAGALPVPTLGVAALLVGGCICRLLWSLLLLLLGLNGRAFADNLGAGVGYVLP